MRPRYATRFSPQPFSITQSTSSTKKRKKKNVTTIGRRQESRPFGHYLPRCIPNRRLVRQVSGHAAPDVQLRGGTDRQAPRSKIRGPKDQPAPAAQGIRTQGCNGASGTCASCWRVGLIFRQSSKGSRPLGLTCWRAGKLSIARGLGVRFAASTSGTRMATWSSG